GCRRCSMGRCRFFKKPCNPEFLQEETEGTESGGFSLGLFSVCSVSSCKNALALAGRNLRMRVEGLLREENLRFGVRRLISPSLDDGKRSRLRPSDRRERPV